MIELVSPSLTHLAAALCGALAALLHTGLTWHSAATTVRVGSIVPCALGFALRLALLSAFAAALVLSEVEATFAIITVITFLGVRWLSVSRATARLNRPMKDAP